MGGNRTGGRGGRGLRGGSLDDDAKSGLLALADKGDGLGRGVLEGDEIKRFGFDAGAIGVFLEFIPYLGLGKQDRDDFGVGVLFEEFLDLSGRFGRAHRIEPSSEIHATEKKDAKQQNCQIRRTHKRTPPSQRFKALTFKRLKEVFPPIMKLLILGFGHVGRSFIGLLPRSFSVSCVSGKGGLANASLDELKEAAQTGRRLEGLADFAVLDPMEAVEDWDYDVLMDLSPTNLETAEPSTTYWRTAFERGCSVISANKGPLAFHYRKMTSLAEQNSASLLFEASVAGGTPVFSLARHCLQGAGLARVEGILNGTTNYILTKMQAGFAYSDALKEAQEKGYAENNPKNDVEGGDALAKAVILANALFGQDATYASLKPEGITRLTVEEVRKASDEKHCFKLLASVDQTRVEVRLSKIPLSHPLASVGDAWNALTFHTRHADAVTIFGRGAGGVPTATAVLNDLLELHGNRS